MVVLRHARHHIHGISLSALLLALMPLSFLQAAGMTGIICGDARVHGAFAEYAPDTGLQVKPITMSLLPLRYEFDSPETGKVRFTYDRQEVVGDILHEDDYLRTMTYVYNDVVYMDTYFIETGSLFSSMHQPGLIGENTATTLRLDCKPAS